MNPKFPYYYRIYYSAARYYEPQWFGSAQDVDAVAHYAVERTKARDGTSAYFRVYWNFVTCKCDAMLSAIDFPTMNSSLSDMADKYPADWTYIHLIQMSCKIGDSYFARQYFDKLTVNERDTWSGDDWDKCRYLVRPAEGNSLTAPNTTPPDAVRHPS